jgi:hypothetical protein
MKQQENQCQQWVTVLSEDDIRMLQRRIYAVSDYLLDLIISRKIDIGKDPSDHEQQPHPEHILF